MRARPSGDATWLAAARTYILCKYVSDDGLRPHAELMTMFVLANAVAPDHRNDLRQQLVALAAITEHTKETIAKKDLP